MSHLRSRLRFSVLLIALAGFALAFSSTAQEAGQQPPQGQGQNQDDGFKIGVEVNMVTVPITIRRPEGGFIKGLQQSAFRIYENGEPQEIVFFAQEGLPTHIAIVLDTSGSVQNEWGSIKYATKRFLSNLKTDDRFALLSFNTEIRLKMDWGRKTDKVDAVLTSIYCKGNTSLWDAIWAVSNDVFKGIQGRKAMIIMSDGLDNQSSVTYKEALDSAVRSEAAIYVVSKTESLRQLALARKAQDPYFGVPHELFADADLALRKLAYETGGRVLYPNSFGQLDDIYAQVDEELRNQYTVGYISSNTIKDGGYRRIEVRAQAPGAVISARPGYYAPDER